MKYLGFLYGGSDTYEKFPDYDRVPYVQSIFKFVFENPAMLNFGINQVKFDMRLLHCLLSRLFTGNQGTGEEKMIMIST